MNLETHSLHAAGPPDHPPNYSASPPGQESSVSRADLTWSSSREERSAYSLYLREIGQIPLLTPEEEVQLALLVQKGDDMARELMIKANLRLVVKIARDYEGYGVPLLDLINEGNIGLMRAVEKYDPSKGAKLSSYSALWIKQSIRRALANQGRDVRLPIHVHEKMLRIREWMLEFQRTSGRKPTSEEIAKGTSIPTHKIALILDSAQHPSFLNAKMGEGDGSSEMGEVIADEQAQDPFDQLNRTNMLELLEQFTQDLKPREKEILGWRFGLHDGVRHTLEEIGEVLGLTREAVRQIQNRALEKLRKRFHRLEGPMRSVVAA